MQPSYDELIRFARLSLNQARFETDPKIAADLRSAAKEYQRKAASLDRGRLPDIGEDNSSSLSSENA
jgi:hypothetical protein